ncbi:MAG: DHH family phosphoesterase, partial [Lachnospiraceae bacterium]|nr:DHH family phosphoesterase [Lachnospiraceae bacterium]
MKKWMSKTYPADFKLIAEKYHISEILARLLVKRGLFDWESINRFLFPDLKNLRDPYQMKDFARAVEIIERAVRERKKIKVVGDYDVDGVTSTYILVQGIRLLGGDAGYRIPHRVKDGYGIRDYMAEEACREGCEILLTCDNGISAYDAVVRAKELGMKVVITDHHEVPKKDGADVVPPADAVVDPKQQSCTYPFKELCGAGIAFKLMLALFERAEREDAAEEFLPFAALATVCDVVPLKDENRILVKHGLKLMNCPGNAGLCALVEAQELQREVNVGDLGFRIGPCINAAGRLADAKTGLELFLEQDAALAEKDSEELVALNEQRKAYTKTATDKAVQMIASDAFPQKKVYVIFLEDCHESIAGIVAGRLREKFFHPVIVLTRGERGLKGSGRS